MTQIQKDINRRKRRAHRLFREFGLFGKAQPVEVCPYGHRSIDYYVRAQMRRELRAELAQVEIAWAFRLLLAEEASLESPHCPQPAICAT